MHYNVHSSTVYNSQEMEVTSMSTNGWINREDVVYMHNRIWKEWKKVIFSNVDGPKDYHVSEMRKTDIISLMGRIWKNDTNEPVYKTE